MIGAFGEQDQKILDEGSLEGGGKVDALLSSVRTLCSLHGKEVSTSTLYSGLPRGEDLKPTIAVRMLEQVGLRAGWVKRELLHLSGYLLPVIQACNDGSYCVLLKRSCLGDGVTYDVVLPEHSGVVVLNEREVKARCTGYYLLVGGVPEITAPREDDGFIGEKKNGHWLFTVVWRYRLFFYSSALAALLANVLTLATTFFTINVYDRVVPTQAYVSLWAMVVGVVIAIVLEFASRQIRAYLLDSAGKKIDLILGATLFRQVMAMRSEKKPSSSGAFANQFREYESVRDFITSATLATLSDLPFCILFLFIIYLIGGQLVVIPLLAIPIILLVSVVCQWPLARYIQENVREISLRQGLLVETLEGMEALKACRGEGVMQRRWDDYSALATASSMKSRFLSSLITNFVMFTQQIVTILIVLVGVYLIHAGHLTMGALIGVVILSGRSLQPLGAVVGLALRFQQAKAGMRSLEQLMSSPVDREAQRKYLSSPDLEGKLSLDRISYCYPNSAGLTAPKALDDVSVIINPGERVVVLGNIGSGKSTLLKVMARLYQQSQGRVAIDDIDASHVDPADWRTLIGYVGQSSHLFFGSLRENVMIGNPSAGTQQFLHVAKMTGLNEIAARHPQGYDMPVGDMGNNLSGGQKQLIALARCLMLEPKILLLDEPTSAMDGLSESRFIQQLSELSRRHTLIVVTHRMSMLSLAERLIVLEDGRLVADGPKAQVLAALNGEARGEARASDTAG